MIKDKEYYKNLYNYIKKENEMLYGHLRMELGGKRAFFITKMVSARMESTSEYAKITDKLKPKN